MTLTATVSPSSATGRVTFYDGTTVLGSAGLSGGVGAITTSALPAGAQLVLVRYSGDSSNGPATSSLSESVNALPSNAFTNAGDYTAAGTVTGDFNGDGKIDIAAARGVMLGKGDGTFLPLIPFAASAPVQVAADFNGDGKLDLAGTNNNGTFVLLGNGDGTFAAPVNIAGSGSSLAIADFNSDGIPDIVVSSGTVLLGNGDGTFRPGPNLSSSASTGVAVGDFNGDGNADIAFSGAILLGNGDGTFQGPISHTSTGSQFVVGDFNLDGKADIAFSTGVLPGNGDGTFQPPIALPQVADYIAIGDFNADGKPDLVAADVSPANGPLGGVSIRFGLGDGSFLSELQIDPSRAVAVAVADFNGDGVADILATTPSGMRILLGVSAAASSVSLSSSPNPSIFNQPVTLTAVVSPANATGTVTFFDDGTSLETKPVIGGVASLTLSSLAAGTRALHAYFAPNATYASSSSAVLVQNVVLLPATGVSLSISANPAVLGQHVTLTATLASPGATGTVTFFDGVKGLGVSNLSGGAAALMTTLLDPGKRILKAYYSGDSRFGPGTAQLMVTVAALQARGFQPIYTVATGAKTVSTGDVNGDGIADVVLDAGTSTGRLLPGKGDGTFGAPVPFTAAFGRAAADFNGDGRIDLAQTVTTTAPDVCSCGFGGTAVSAVILLSNGDGTYQQSSDYLIAYTTYFPPTQSFISVSDLQAVDVNGDGKPDLIALVTVSNKGGSSGAVVVLIGNGDGTFKPTVDYLLDGWPAAGLAAADLNGDGKLDLADGEIETGIFPSSAYVRVLPGNGDGTFPPPQGSQVQAGLTALPNSMIAADFDGDGNIDIAVATTNGVTLLFGTGRGTFSGAATYGSGTNFMSLAAADFNGDGRTDLALVDSSGNVSILLALPGTQVPLQITSIASGLQYPAGVAVDNGGNVYFADTYNSRIAKIAAGTGVITTVAGNGVAGFSGDGGPAVNAGLNYPYGVAVDASGNIYIADSGNNRIRKVTAATGVITTVAGNGASGFSGDGGAATSAALNYPLGVAVDGSGNVYIADTFNSAVRKVAAATGVITTIAGSSTLNHPFGVAVDGTGNVYIADSYNQRIEKLTSTGVLSVIAGNGVAGFSGDGGAATSAGLAYPFGVAVDAVGNVYIADSFNSRIREIAAATGVITTIAGVGGQSFSGDGGPATSAGLDTPYGIAATAGGTVYFSDTGNGRIRKLSVSP